MDRNDSNPGMIERQLDESPMEGRSSSDTELDRDHLQRDRSLEREGMQGDGLERDSMRGDDLDREPMRGDGVERESMREEGLDRENDRTTPARDW